MTAHLKLCVLLPLLALAGCTYSRADEAARAAETMGFRDVVVHGGSMWTAQWNGCGRDDGSYYDVEATNTQGARVSLIACCAGWSDIAAKGCTVRVR